MKKFLSLIVVFALILSLCSFPIGTKAAFVPTLTIDMGAKSGAMRHGSGGFLYGLGSHGTPSANILTPLKPSTAVQKAPDGLQHPTGDVLDVAETFISAGGEQVQIYLQDIYALWPYEQTSFEEYLIRIEEMVPKIVELRNSNPAFSGKLVYVPFNEPDGIWYGNIGWDASVQSKFNNHWKSAYDLIKSLDPDALIAGTSCANYQSGHFDSWLSFCCANSCEPDYITWHELQDYDLASFKSNLDNYRALEAKYNMTEREIIINEYAPQDHCSDPGKLVNWIALFEENKVSGCLPYWHNAGNLNDIAADNNEPNGAWWLYKWYGDMSGETLSLTTNTGRTEFYGLSSIDDNKKSSTVIFGGTEGDGQILLQNINSAMPFASSAFVDVTVEATYWSAFHGVANEPPVIIKGTFPVLNGSVTINIPGMEKNAAYKLTVTPSSEEKASLYYSYEHKLYEIEDGVHAGAAYPNNTRWTYAYSGGYRLSGIQSASDGCNLQLEVDHTGYYKMDITYSNGYGANSANPDQNDPKSLLASLKFDSEAPDTIVLENTLRDEMAGMYTTYVYLTKGAHMLYIRGDNSNGGAFSMDSASFTYVGGTIPEFDSLFEAEAGDFNILADSEASLITTESTVSGFSGAGYITGLEKRSVTSGGGVRFTAVVPENSLYTIALCYNSDEDTAANIYLDNTALDLDNLLSTVSLPKTDGFENCHITAFLQKGINIIDIDTEGVVLLDYMRIKKASSDPITVQAEDSDTDGNAQVFESGFAQNGKYVSNIQGATDDRLTLNFTAPHSGDYKMVIHHSSGELFGAHTYNAQLVDRYASFKVNKNEPQRLYFKNTYSSENWRTTVLNVTLNEGENSIEIFNDNWRTVSCGTGTTGNITYRELVNYTPNFDLFEFYPAVSENQSVADSYIIKVMTSPNGTVDTDHSSVTAGESVTLSLFPEYNEGKVKVSANSQDISHLISGYSLTYLPTADTEFSVDFIIPENLDNNIKNSSFGDGDFTAWENENSSIVSEDEYHYASIGTISQTFDAPMGYFDISFKARGENVTVTANSTEKEIVLSSEWQTYKIRCDSQGSITLKLNGVADCDDFKLEKAAIDSSLLYFADCGDIDPETLSNGDCFGLCNSITDQFYAPDPVTGFSWGVVDTYVKSESYPYLLTGSETWPYEYDLEDGEDKVITYRYAKDQDDRTGNGITYKFELPDGDYVFEAAFYAPSHWMNDVNRKASLTVNGITLAQGIIPKSDAQHPVIVNRVAPVTGGSASINLKLDGDGSGGPMISYIKISKAEEALPLTLLDRADFTVTSSATWNNDPQTHGKFAFDGNINTYFDGISGGSLVCDLGYETSVSAIGYIPRNSWSSRMNTTYFYGSNDKTNWEKLFVVSQVPPEGEETIVNSNEFLNNGRFRYIKYENPYDYCNVAEINIYKETGTLDFVNLTTERFLEDVFLKDGIYNFKFSHSQDASIIQSEVSDGILSFVKTSPLNEAVEQISPTENIFIWDKTLLKPLAIIKQ